MTDMPTVKRRLKTLLLSIPAVRARWEALRAPARAPLPAFAGLPIKDVFTHIYERNLWGDTQSRSGSGSNADRTATLRRELPIVLERLGCRTLLDAPCGDFGWLSELPLGLDRYIGCDIVDALIQDNRRRFGAPGRDFRVLDVIQDELPRVDLILCRDLLVHLSNRDGLRVIENFARSGSTWLLATTFIRQPRNADIGVGGWRPVNLELAPFSLGRPELLLDEECNEQDGIYRDKQLGLWRLDAIAPRA